MKRRILACVLILALLASATCAALADTTYSCYTSSGYIFWKDQVLPMISRYQEEMAGLNAQRIVGHDRLAEEVTVTEYEDGTKVYVNYSNTDYTAEGISVPARDYAVKGGND